MKGEEQLLYGQKTTKMEEGNLPKSFGILYVKISNYECFGPTNRAMEIEVHFLLAQQ